MNVLQARDTENRVNLLTQRDYPVMVELTQLLTDLYNTRWPGQRDPAQNRFD